MGRTRARLLQALCSGFIVTASGTTLAAVDVAVSGGSRIGGLQFTVVDLDLNDGIAAGYTFISGAQGPVGHSFARALTTAASDPPCPDCGWIDSTDGFLQPLSKASLGTDMHASLSIAASGIEAAGSTHQPGSSLLAIGYSRASSPPAASFPLLLTANTQLVVTALADTFATVSTGCAWEPAGLCGDVRAQAELSGRMMLPGAGTQSATLTSVAGEHLLHPFVDAFGQPIIVWDAPTGYGPSDTDQSFLSITLSNPTALSVGAYLQLDAVLVATAVPEPATYALLAMGLGMLALAARRRAAGRR